jgi:Protein of unknown function (DUF2568)
MNAFARMTFSSRSEADGFPQHQRIVQLACPGFFDIEPRIEQPLKMVSSLRWTNVALRGLMEAGIVAAMAYWGAWAGTTAVMKVALGVGAPVVVFGIWGAVDFRRAGALAEWLRLAEELVLSAVAVAALYVAGQPLFALILAAASIAHHALVYACGDTLLKRTA